MTIIDDKIRDEKLQYNINREAAKISALSFGKTDKYEYLTGEEILPPGQRRVIQQAKFACCQKLKSTEGLFPKEMRNDEIKNEIDEIKKWKNKI